MFFLIISNLRIIMQIKEHIFIHMFGERKGMNLFNKPKGTKCFFSCKCQNIYVCFAKSLQSFSYHCYFLCRVKKYVDANSIYSLLRSEIF